MFHTIGLKGRLIYRFCPCRETTLGHLRGVGVSLLDVSVKMEIIDFLLPRIKQNCRKYDNYTPKMSNRN